MKDFTNWTRDDALPALEHHQIHLWQIDLDLPQDKIAKLSLLLNEAECARAQRLHFQRDRERFIVARGCLRSLLGLYTKLPPTQLEFDLNAYGKPSLKQRTGLQFNLSHAQSKALVAITWAPAVGVDIEYCTKDVDIDGIAQRFFTSGESASILRLSGAARRQAFFAAWVRKEAFLKALGQGISYGLDKVEVNLLPGQAARIVALHDPALTLEDWRLYVLRLSEPYQGALVAKTSTQPLRLALYNFRF